MTFLVTVSYGPTEIQDAIQDVVKLAGYQNVTSVNKWRVLFRKNHSFPMETINEPDDDDIRSRAEKIINDVKSMVEELSNMIVNNENVKKRLAE